MTSAPNGAEALEILPCPFCGSPAELEQDSDHHGSWYNLGCSRHWGRVAPEKACKGGRLWYTQQEEDTPLAEAVEAWNTRASRTSLSREGERDRLPQPMAGAAEDDEHRATADLDARMKAAGMIPLTDLLDGNTATERWLAHKGVTDIESFAAWLSRKHREFMTMRMAYELGDEPKDELYEWVFAHAAAFGEVAANLRAALTASPAGDDPEADRASARYVRHKKTGGNYEVVGIAKMQAAMWAEVDEYGDHLGGVDMREVVVYRSVEHGTMWVRPVAEFEDGRFQDVPAPASVAAASSSQAVSSESVEGGTNG